MQENTDMPERTIKCDTIPEGKQSLADYSEITKIATVHYIGSKITKPTTTHEKCIELNEEPNESDRALILQNLEYTEKTVTRNAGSPIAEVDLKHPEIKQMSVNDAIDEEDNPALTTHDDLRTSENYHSVLHNNENQITNYQHNTVVLDASADTYPRKTDSDADPDKIKRQLNPDNSRVMHSKPSDDHLISNTTAIFNEHSERLYVRVIKNATDKSNVLCQMKNISSETIDNSTSQDFGAVSRVAAPRLDTAAGNETGFNPLSPTIALSISSFNEDSKVNHDAGSEKNKEPISSSSNIAFCTKLKKSKRMKRKVSATSLNISPRNVCKDDTQEKKRQKTSDIGTIFRKFKNKIFKKNTKPHRKKQVHQSPGCHVVRRVSDNFTQERSETVRTRSQTSVKDKKEGMQEKKENLNNKRESRNNRDQNKTVSEIAEAIVRAGETVMGNGTFPDEADTNLDPEDNTGIMEEKTIKEMQTEKLEINLTTIESDPKPVVDIKDKETAFLSQIVHDSSSTEERLVPAGIAQTDDEHRLCNSCNKGTGIETQTQDEAEEDNESVQKENHAKAISQKSDISIFPEKISKNAMTIQKKYEVQLKSAIGKSAIARLKRGRWLEEEKVRNTCSELIEKPAVVAAENLICLKTIEGRDFAEWAIDISNLLADDVVKTVYKLREKLEHDENNEDYPEYKFLSKSEMERRLETVQMQVKGRGRKSYQEFVKLAAEQKTRERRKANKLQNSTTTPNKGKDEEDQTLYYNVSDIIKLARRMHYGGYKGKRYLVYLQEKEEKEKEEKEAKLNSLFEELFDDGDDEYFTELSEDDSDRECIHQTVNKGQDTKCGQDVFSSDADNLSDDVEDCDEESDDEYSDKYKGQTLQTDRELKPQKKRTVEEILVQYWHYDDKRERIIDKEWVSWGSPTGFAVEPKVKRKEIHKIDRLERKIMMNKKRKSFYLGKERLNRSQNAAGIDRVVAADTQQLSSEENQTDWEMLKQLLLSDDRKSSHESHLTYQDEVPFWQRKRTRHIQTLY